MMVISGEGWEPGTSRMRVTCDTRQEVQYSLALLRQLQDKESSKRCLEGSRSGEGLRIEAVGPGPRASAETQASPVSGGIAHATISTSSGISTCRTPQACGSAQVAVHSIVSYALSLREPQQK